MTSLVSLIFTSLVLEKVIVSRFICNQMKKFSGKILKTKQIKKLNNNDLKPFSELGEP